MTKVKTRIRNSLCVMLMVCLTITMFPVIGNGISGIGSGQVYAASSGLSGDQRTDVLKIAKSCQDMTLAKSKTKLKSYGKKLYKPNYEADWCAWWVSNVAKEAGVKTSVIPHVTFADGHRGSTDGYYNWAKSKGLYRSKKSYTPKAGDLALFGTSTSNIYHVEIVYSVSKKGTVKTIGGNTGGKSWPYSVVSKPQAKSGICGYVVVKYPSAAKVSHTFSYNLNGGNGSFSSATVKDGDKLTIPSTKPTKAKYDFQGFYVKRNADSTWYVAGSGWVAEKNLGGKTRKLYSSGGTYTIDASWTKGSAKSSYTFYAQWKAKPEFTLKFNPNTGTGSMPQKTIKLTGGTISFDTVNQFKRDGYEMNGWNVQRIALDGSVYWIVPNGSSWAWKKNAAVSERKLYKYTDRFTFGTNGISAGDTIVVWATWKAIPTAKKTIEDGTYHIVSGLDENYGLDVYDASTTNGANVQIYRNTNDNTQTFDVTHLGGGYYSIIATHSGKSLDVDSARAANKTNVQIWTAGGGDYQKWIIHDLGNGYYSIISKCNGLWLDVNGGKAANSTNVSMYQDNGSLAQSWKFVPVKAMSPVAEEQDFDDYDDYDEDLDEDFDEDYDDEDFDEDFNEGLDDEDAVNEDINEDLDDEDAVDEDINEDLDDEDAVDEDINEDLDDEDAVDEDINEDFDDETTDESDVIEGPIEEPEAKEPVYVWSDWSEYTTTPVSASDTCEVQTVKEYRYRDKQTTTSGETALSGWTKYDTKSSVSTSDYKFGTPIATSTSMANNRKTVTSAVNKGYYYYAYVVANPSDTSDWCYYADKTRAKVISHMKANFSNSTVWAEKRLRYFWYVSPTDLGAMSGKLKKTIPYCADSTVSVGTFSQKATHYYDIAMYRYNQCYKVKTETTINYFYKWGNWSAWSGTAYSGSDTRQVETRTLYRYRELVEE